VKLAAGARSSRALGETLIFSNDAELTLVQLAWLRATDDSIADLVQYAFGRPEQYVTFTVSATPDTGDDAVSTDDVWRSYKAMGRVGRSSV
jgi:hypothetical protein